ncbi:MAG: flippase [Candidatus Latescibacteria bacterium]|nr:flippase [Candidatus Latescibacterota bacterium]
MNDHMNPTRAVRTTFVVFGGQVAARLFDLGGMLLIARSFGEAAFGQFSFAVAYVGYFAILADFGCNAIFVRELARSRERAAELLAGMLAIRSALILVGMGLAIALILIPGYPPDTVRLVRLMAVALLISPKLPSLRVVYEQVFQVRLQMGIPTLLKLLDGGLFLSLAYGLIRSGQPLDAVMMAYVLSSLPGLVLVAWMSRRFIVPSGRVDRHLIARLLKQALPMALLVGLTALYTRIDVLILSLWRGDVEVGYYSAAYRLTEALRLIPAAVITSLYPVLVDAYARASAAFAPAITAGLKSLLIVIIPIALGLVFCANQVVTVLYTGRFAPAGTALAILIWAEVCLFINCPLSYALISADRQQVVTGIACIMLVINLTANALLIPRWGYLGASTATVMTEGAGTLCYGMATRHLLGGSFWRVVLPLLPGAGLFLMGMVAARTIPVPIAVAVSILVYVLSLRLTGGITRSDLAALRTAFVGP